MPPTQAAKARFSGYQVAPGDLSQSYKACAMNRRAKAPQNHGPDPALLFADGINTWAGPSTGSRSPASPSPQSTGETRLSEQGKEFISPKGRAEAFHAPVQLQLTHPAALQELYKPCRAVSPKSAKTHGIGTIFRPVLTMTSSKTSVTEPFASSVGTADTRMPAATRLNHRHGRQLAAQFPQNRGGSEPSQMHNTHSIQMCATTHEDRFAQDSSRSVQFSKSSWWL